MQTFSSLPAGRWRPLAALSVVYIVWGTTYYALGVAMRTLQPVLMTGRASSSLGR
ncbi:hypothetical protein [Tepidimonas sp.]|mgnify:CR=1 FL=1|uniref:hypothetical protein n=1 Tax=Tepidimonas sp. TaxID=2002775 RepID=UPI002FE03CF6